MITVSIDMNPFIHHHYFSSNPVQTVAQELHALQVLEHDMTINLEYLRELRSEAQYLRTFRGRIINFGQRIFAIYCMIRVVSVSSSFLFILNIKLKFYFCTGIVNLQCFLSPITILIDHQIISGCNNQLTFVPPFTPDFKYVLITHSCRRPRCRVRV